MSASKNDRSTARRARLVQALAATPRRTRGGNGDTELKAQARMAALELKHEAARRALELREAEEARSAHQRFGRLAELGKLKSTMLHQHADLDKRLTEALESGDVEAAGGLMAYKLEVSQRLDAIKLEQGVLFGQPIHPSDLDANGRFMRSIRYHGREVVFSHMSVRGDDLLSRALELAFLNPAEDLTEVTRGFDRDGRAIIEQWPTLGAMYRNVKRAYRDALDEARKVRRGLVAVHSLEELAAGGAEPDAHWEHYGVGYVDPAEIEWDAVVSGRVQDAELSRYAMIDADQRARRAAAERAAAESRRNELVSAASAPVGSSKGERADFEVDRILIEGLIDGETLADLAGELGVSVDTLTARLLKRDLTVGLTA